MDSNDVIRNQSEDVDPLSDFVLEQVKPDAEPQNYEHSSATIAPADPELVAALRNRIATAESIVEKTQETIVALNNRVETLVSAVADLNKRLDHQRNAIRVQTPVAPPPRIWNQTIALGLGAAGIVTILLVALLQTRADPRQSVAPTTLDAPSRIQPREASPAIVTSAIVPATAPATPQRASTSATPPASPPRPGPQVSPRQQPARAPAAPEETTAAYVGTLSIDSEPEGQVLINRRNAGRTPLKLENLKAGSHLIWIERDGYQRWTRVVQVPANRVSRVSASLEPVR